ncbi:MULTISPECIES: bifunctional folylpolyglutamate synthase/dihydrofolate synthase [Flavobacterium]|uniref:Dihydrofolate synthase/folylpolyglutamate synthase n=1 Tax=Flavobacterium columnare TaxID=996 RepID=A0AA94F1V1_9FLAO|nr:folylpolyglutamate synthase/dihydrofolate synthase family protein [Flavobacterium columnare]MCH4830980.1 bifunctional folylpolyglutamate synthase/dihydrofolate synthase [Flavobacterium columnare]MCH4833079.1 bifunctional folylpolyglutamate synthase/dihydrofolate synthase [Flavobacterium columnare]
MTYQETIQWMFAQLPMYQQQGATAYKKDLTNTVLLANHLGNPEKRIKTIHIAGTNGKGSTSSMLASILQEAGYKVGLYTSPHLKDYRERIRINGVVITEDYVVEFIRKNKTFFEENHLSFFEMTVGLAFQYFADKNVDIGIIEVGLGGRLDSTNIITPLISVITNIGWDHVQFLGTTLCAIASEKAGIIKSNVPVVIGEYLPETQSVFLEKAKKMNSTIYFASDRIFEEYECELLGDYQKQNKKTVLQTIEVLQDYFVVTEEQLKKGLLSVVRNTGLLGRWQQLDAMPKVICDTAHNSHGLKIVLNQIKKETYDRLFFILGVVNDKDLDDILPLFPKDAYYIFTKPNVPRGLAPEKLKIIAESHGLIFNEIVSSVSDSYKRVKDLASAQDFIYIGGSTFVVAEIV